MAKGDHIYVTRPLGYTHHGIDCGDGTVIHFTGEPGKKMSKSEAGIARSMLSDFALDSIVHVREYSKRDDVLGAVGAGGRIKSQWVKLPKWGKIAVAAGIPVAVVLLLFGGGGRDKESYAFGYRHGSSGLTKDWVRGTSDGAKKTCEDIVDFYIDLSKKKEIDRGDAVEGCVDAVNGRPLGPG